MQYVVLISEMVQEVNRLRRSFDASLTVKATGSTASAMALINLAKPAAIVYHIGSKMDNLFPFYKQLRTNPKCDDIPLVIMADINILKPLSDTVELKNTEIIGSSISGENLMSLIHRLIGEEKADGE